MPVQKWEEGIARAQTENCSKREDLITPKYAKKLEFFSEETER